ncbi:MAG: hypothetical protein U1E60_00295 [Reyranellaceae bacterium]
MTPEFKAAYDLLDKEIEGGWAVLSNAGAVDVVGRPLMLPEERHEYIVRAAAHFRSLESTASHYAALPVDIQTFVESQRMLNRRGVVYPSVMAELIELNSGRYVESVLTGGIGSGKTTAALLTMAYQIYVLSCLKDPHRTFAQDPAAELLTVFQSLNAQVAKNNDYARFRAMIGGAPYFTERFPFNRGLEAEMIFPRRIVVRPLSGSVHAAIGANVLNALIDEINFMRIVERSANAVDGGVFNQALEMYNGLVRRRKTRFLTADRLPGMVCLVSSKRYPGEFTDLKIAEARREIAETGATRIFVYDKTVFDVKPPGTYSGQRFALFLGDLARKPRLLEPGEPVAPADAALVKHIPVEFRSEFEHDLLSAIRDIAGASTFALHPFLVNTAAVARAFGARRSILSLERTDFVATRPVIYPQRIERPEEPRLAHVDLAVSGDSAGIAIGHVDRFVAVPRGEGMTETLPHIAVDAILEIAPPRNGEIEFESIRRLFLRLVELGMNLKWITFDTFQSRDSMQLLRQKGFMTGPQSMDSDPMPYDVTKTALYDGRVAAPAHVRAQAELVRLERDPRTGRIDHPPNFSKDCADALAGVVFGLSYRRESWVRHGVPMQGSLLQIAGRLADRDARSAAASRAGAGRHDLSVGIEEG